MAGDCPADLAEARERWHLGDIAFASEIRHNRACLIVPWLPARIEWHDGHCGRDRFAAAPAHTRPRWSVLLWGLLVRFAAVPGDIWYRPETPRLGGAGAVRDAARPRGAPRRRCWRWCCAAGPGVILLAALAVTLSWPVFSHRARRRSSPIRRGSRSCPPISGIGAPATTGPSNADGKRCRHHRPGRGDAGMAAGAGAAARQVSASDRLLRPRSGMPDDGAVQAADREADRRPRSGARRRSSRAARSGGTAASITVLATHWFRPLVRSDESQWGDDDAARSAYLAERLPVSRQAGQAGLFAKYLDRAAPRDLIVMGDFNSAPWSRVQRAFRAKTGLDNQAGWDAQLAVLPALAAAPADRPRAGARASRRSRTSRPDRAPIPIISRSSPRSAGATSRRCLRTAAGCRPGP